MHVSRYVTLSTFIEWVTFPTITTLADRSVINHRTLSWYSASWRNDCARATTIPWYTGFIQLAFNIRRTDVGYWEDEAGQILGGRLCSRFLYRFMFWVDFYIYSMIHIFLKTMKPLLVLQYTLGFPLVPGGQKHSLSSEHRAPIPHWLQVSRHWPLSQNWSLLHSLLLRHSIRTHPADGSPLYPMLHLQIGCWFSRTQNALFAQTVFLQGLPHLLATHFSFRKHCESDEQIFNGKHPFNGNPVVPIGQIHDAEWCRGWQTDDKGHGLLEARHGLRHWPL